MRQSFWNKTLLSIGFWIVLGGVGAMFGGWSAGAGPAHSVQGQSFGGLSTVGLSTVGLSTGGFLTGSGSTGSGLIRAGSGQQGLISYVQTSDTKATSVILIDPVRQVMSVYHIGREDGQIQLKSVRQIAWDMSLTDYNTSKPLPEDIHKGLQRQ